MAINVEQPVLTVIEGAREPDGRCAERATLGPVRRPLRARRRWRRAPSGAGAPFGSGAPAEYPPPSAWRALGLRGGR